jgi:F-type H+-transporting ATPase subunit delta
MKNSLLAKRYAKALFDLAVEDNVIESTSKDMLLVTAVMNENRELRKLMTNPVIPPARKKLIIRKVFENHLGKHSLTFLDILVRKGREMNILEIAHQFNELYLDHKNIASVDITTAIEINAELRDKLVKRFKELTSKTLQMTEHIDPEIIGGFVLKMDDYLYNASVSEEISRLHKEFDKNLYIKGF